MRFKLVEMGISLKPETEQLVQEEIRNGHFRSIDDLIVEGVNAWRQRLTPARSSSEQRRQAIERALSFAKDRAIPLEGITIKGLIHEGHRL